MCGESGCLSHNARTNGGCSWHRSCSRVLVGLKQTKMFYVLNLLLAEQHSEEVSRGQKEIRPINGKIGSFVAIKNPGPDATAGSGSCPSADCQSGGTAASACPHFLQPFPKHPLLFMRHTTTRPSYLDRCPLVFMLK